MSHATKGEISGRPEEGCQENAGRKGDAVGNDTVEYSAETSPKRSSRIKRGQRRDGVGEVDDGQRHNVDAADRPTLEDIFEDKDKGSSGIFDTGTEDEAASPDLGSRRRKSSAGSRKERTSSTLTSARRNNQQSSRRPRESSSRHERHPNVSSGPQLLSETRHATRSLISIGAGCPGPRRPRKRAELKEQDRAREWATFCRRKTYLSLEDLSREERPRIARKGVVTPFALSLIKVEGWQVPSLLVVRATTVGCNLRFSLSVSFYHAASKRFYGNTFMGGLLDERDGDRVEVISEKRRRASLRTRAASQKMDDRSRSNSGRKRIGKGRRSEMGARGGIREGEKDEDADEDEGMEVTTKHEELVYWYTRFEDPNCIAVVELVATLVDVDNGVQVGQYGCGWTFIQLFGTNDPEAVQQRDVYHGSPRTLLFFEQGDWGRLGGTAIPGCSLCFTLSIWEHLLRARHLFRNDEIVSATDVLPGTQHRKITVPGEKSKVGPFLGLNVEEGSTRASRRRDNPKEAGRWSVSPARPRLAACLEFRLSSFHVVIPGRYRYEKELLRSLEENSPEQEIVKTTTTQHSLGFSRTQREVAMGGAARGTGWQRAKILDRRAKIGFHNGYTLVLPHEWVEAHLEETQEEDVLMLPENVSSLTIDGYVRHPLFALVVLVEFTVRTKPKKGGGGRAKKGDPLSQAQAELSHAALPVVVGMQVFVPHDGTRVRLRNAPRNEDNIGVCLMLAADRRVRLVTSNLVNNKAYLLDESRGGTSEDEIDRGQMMAYFDLRAYDSQGKMLVDETPASGDESPLEASGWEPPKQDDAAENQSSTSSSTETTSSESPPEPSERDEIKTKPFPKPKKVGRKKPTVKPRRVKSKKKPAPTREPSSDVLSSESVNPSLVTGDSDSSYLKHPKPAKRRNAHVQVSEDGWDKWRKSVKVPRSRESLMGQTLQATLHAETSAQTAATSQHEPNLSLFTPEAVVIGGVIPLAQELSRGNRTRLSRHGFTDVMKDKIDSFAQIGGAQAGQPLVPVDLDLEATDPLAKHEITFQFAAFRAPPGSRSDGFYPVDVDNNRGRGGQGSVESVPMPASLYFTYQFYTCQPTRTERMLLRPDAPRDRLYQSEDGSGTSRLNILVREGRHGKDEPSLGLRHSIDTTLMQPFEAQAFSSYMAGRTLFMDVWDADALMHVGTLALPLRTLMRQQKGVVKTAMEYEVVATAATTDDCGSGGGITVKHGTFRKGPVVGLVQILASNYGEIGKGGNLPGAGALPGAVHPVFPGPNIRGDWRMASGPAVTLGDRQPRTRPRYKVRARPLSEMNPELSKHMAIIAGSRAGGRAIASLVRKGRGDVDCDSMGYDELMLLVRRFRGSVKGKVWYAGPLLRLLNVPGRKKLEQRLVRAVERSERSGIGLTEAFRVMDQKMSGEISTQEVEEMFWGMLAPGELAREHVRAVVKSMDAGATGKIGLRELVTFVRARQGGKTGKNVKAAEAGLRRAIARAALGGAQVEDDFYRLDDRGDESISHTKFWEAVRNLGGLPGVVKADLDPFLRRLDTSGEGRVSLPALMEWAGRDPLSAAGVENEARKKILSAEAATKRKGHTVSIQEAFSSATCLADALKTLDNVKLTSREISVLDRRFGTAEGGTIDTAAVAHFFGRNEASAESSIPPNNYAAEVVDQEAEGGGQSKESRHIEEEDRIVSAVKRKLKSIVLKAEGKGISMAETFGVFDKNGSGYITASELEEGLRDLGVFQDISREQMFSVVRSLKKGPSDGGALDTTPKSEDSGDLLVSAEEFVRFAGGEYEETEAAQARLRKVLTAAEERGGVTLGDTFGAFDKSGTGRISIADLEDGLRQLGVLDRMSRQQACLATTRFDQSGDGTISLPEFLAFVGKPYTANDRPLEAKLRRVLLKAESMGTSMEDAFKHFDKNGCGFITNESFSTGLREMGVFEEFSEKEVAEVISHFGADSDGTVSLPKFLCFLGKEYGTVGKAGRGRGGARGFAERLRQILMKAHELGTPVPTSFEIFGADEYGRVSARALHRALKDIGQFRWTTLGEVKAFICLLQDDEVNEIPRSTTLASSDASARIVADEPGPFLTLPTLQLFVERGEAFLAEKERSLLVRQEAGGVIPVGNMENPVRGPSRVAEEKAGDEASHSDYDDHKSSRSKREVFQYLDGGNKTTITEYDKKDILLEVLRGVLSRAPGAEKSFAYGRGGGVRGHLDSFDVDGDGILTAQEFVTALRSLGAKGENFNGWRKIDHLVSRFRDDSESSGRCVDGVSIVKVTKWFDGKAEDESSGKETSHRHGSNGDKNDAASLKGQGHRDIGKVSHVARAEGHVPGQALRRAVWLAEAKGMTLERTFARLDENGDGFITLRQLLRGLDNLGVFKQATRDDVLDVLDVLDDNHRSSRSIQEKGHEESKIGQGDDPHGVDLVGFIRLMRQGPTCTVGGEAEICDDIFDGGEGKQEDDGRSTYEFSLDPETRAAEKKIRRVVAKQARLGVDVEGIFQRYDPDQTGSILRSDFVQAVMELGVGVLETCRHDNRFDDASGRVAPARSRHVQQLARAKGPVEGRLVRMRQTRRSLFQREVGKEERVANDREDDFAPFEEGDEGLALIQWYREGQKKSMMRHILATSLTTEYNLFFSFASPLFFEHPLRNPFNHEERFRIELDDHQLRVVTAATEWEYLRRHATPCIGDIGDTPVEAEFFDVDPQNGVHITLMAHEVVFIPFAFLSLEPRRPTPQPPESLHKPQYSERRSAAVADGQSSKYQEGGAAAVERSVVVAFVSSSHGHIVSVIQVHLHRRPFVINRTFRFYQNEGEILKRSIRLSLGGNPGSPLRKTGTSSRFGTEADLRKKCGVSLDNGDKYVHCVEEACQKVDDISAGECGVMIEWIRRSAVENDWGGELQEVLVKCRVGQFPGQKTFFLLVYDDQYQGSLYETWHIVVQARLRMDIHALLGQQSPADLIVRGDRYSRKVRAFSSAPAEVAFKPNSAFQLVPGAYNRLEVRFQPLSIGSRRIHVHLVDVDSMEIVGAWLATATAMPPVVTKSYEVDLPLGRACHKRIAYSNPWTSARVFRLVSSDPSILRPRYESLEVAGGGTGYFRLWFAALIGTNARKEAFLFVNDIKGQSEECLLICARGI